MTNRYRLSSLCLLIVLASCGPHHADEDGTPHQEETRSQEGTLYEKASPYNTIVVDQDARGLRTLRFEKGGIRQSVVKPGDPDHLELAYARVMPVGLAAVERPTRVLIVGLGGGTIPSFLRHHFPLLEIDVVDIDPDVVDVAKRFFGFKEDAKMRAHVADGRQFIARHRGRYDIIFLDAYGPDSIPYHLGTREFLRLARQALTPGGVVVANVWGTWSNPLYASMICTYEDGFDKLYVIDVKDVGNKVLLACQRPVERGVLVRRASELSRQSEFPFDLGKLVDSGFRPAGPDGVSGRILRDADKEQPARQPAAPVGTP